MPISKFAKKQAEVHIGDLPENLLLEFQKPNFVLIPILDITFPEEPTTEVLYPNSDEVNDDMVVFPSGAMYAALDDPRDSPDGDTTYVRGDSSPDNTRRESRVGFEAMNPEAVSITEVRLFVRGRALAADDGLWSFALRHSSANYYRDGGTIEDLFLGDLDYRTMFFRYPVQPDSGEAWTQAAVNALQASLIMSATAAGDADGHRFTQTFLEVDYTTQDVGRYSTVAVNSRSEGLFEPLVRSFDNVDINIMSPSNALQDQNCGCILYDPERKFSTLIASQRKVRGAEVRIRWVSEVSKDDWFVAFKGVLQSFDEQDTNVWKLKFKVDSTPFDGSSPRLKFSEQDFNSAPDPKVYDQYVPYVWGVHDSTELNDDGMIKLFRVGDTDFVSAFGRIKDHRRLYTFESGDPPTVTLLTETTDWIEWFPIRNGRQYSGVQLVGSGAATNKEKEIRADVEGYEETGDGTGLLITNPSLTFLHWLTNFVLNDYQSGLWFDPNDEAVDLVRFLEARDFFNLTGQASARYIGGKSSSTSIKQEINRWTKNLEAKIWWNHQNEIAVGINDPFTTDVYPDRELLEGLHDLSKAKYRNVANKILNRITISYLRQEAENSFLANVSVEDTEVTDGASENIQAFWLPSSLPQYIESP